MLLMSQLILPLYAAGIGGNGGNNGNAQDVEEFKNSVTKIFDILSVLSKYDKLGEKHRHWVLKLNTLLARLSNAVKDLVLWPHDDIMDRRFCEDLEEMTKLLTPPPGTFSQIKQTLLSYFSNPGEETIPIDQERVDLKTILIAMEWHLKTILDAMKKHKYIGMKWPEMMVELAKALESRVPDLGSTPGQEEKEAKALAESLENMTSKMKPTMIRMQVEGLGENDETVADFKSSVEELKSYVEDIMSVRPDFYAGVGKLLYDMAEIAKPTLAGKKVIFTVNMETLERGNLGEYKEWMEWIKDWLTIGEEMTWWFAR